MTSPQVALVRHDVVDGTLGKRLCLTLGEANLESFDNLPGDLLLNCEHVLCTARILLGPEM